MSQSSNRWGDFLQHGVLAWRLFRDKRVSPTLKLIPIASLLYIISPVDLLPDVIPILGQVDDLGIFLLALQLFINLSPQDVVERYRYQLGLPSTYVDEDNIIDVEAEWLDFDDE